MYGPWRHHRPSDAATFFAEYEGDWWIAGGWAIEAFTGVARSHGDLDINIPRTQVPLLRDFLNGRLDVWAADRGTLTPLIPGDDAPLSPTCGNLWLRPSGAEPWEYDIVLTLVTDEVWTYKRDPRIALPLSEILWSRGGITYLRPEIQLLHKAPGLRDKDVRDFENTQHLLDDGSRARLSDFLQLAHPSHPWIAELGH